MKQRPPTVELVGFAIAALIASFPSIAAEGTKPYSIVDYVDLAVKIAGVLAAALFFIYKAMSGSLAAETSITITVQPIRVRGKATGLVSLVLERGENYSILIERIVVRVDLRDEAAWESEVTFKDIGRHEYHLSPRERTQYGIAIPLNDDDVTSVSTVVVLRQQAFFSVPAHVFSSIVVAPPSTDSAAPIDDPQ